MRAAAPTSSGDALTDLILTMFRVNNLTLTWGDRLVAPFGLTSARWQVLGAIVFAERRFDAFGAVLGTSLARLPLPR